MTQRVESMISLARRAGTRYDSDEIREAVDFLAWLLRGNFVLLGAREYEITDGAYRCIPGSGLGILSDEERSAYSTPVPLARAPGGAAHTRASTVSCCWSTRPTRSRRSTAASAWTTSACAASRRTASSRARRACSGCSRARPTPSPRPRRRCCTASCGGCWRPRTSSRARTTTRPRSALFDTFPKDELFAAPVDDLRRAVVALLALEGTDRVRLLGRRARDGRSASFILALPRDRYRALLVERVSRACSSAASRRRDVEAQHMLGEGGNRVRVHFRVHGPDGLPEIDRDASKRDVVQLARTWDDALADALAERTARRTGGCCGRSGLRFLPEHYKGYTAPPIGALDIALLEQLSEQGPFLVSLQPLDGAHADRAVQARAEGRAGRGAADARGPRAARDRGDLDAADRRRRDVGPGVPRARAGRRAAGPRRGR